MILAYIYCHFIQPFVQLLNLHDAIAVPFQLKTSSYVSSGSYIMLVSFGMEIFIEINLNILRLPLSTSFHI